MDLILLKVFVPRLLAELRTFNSKPMNTQRRMRIIFDTNQLATGQDTGLTPVVSSIFNLETNKEERSGVAMKHIKDGVYVYDYTGEERVDNFAPISGSTYIISIAPGGALANAVQTQDFNFYQ